MASDAESGREGGASPPSVTGGGGSFPDPVAHTNARLPHRVGRGRVVRNGKRVIGYGDSDKLRRPVVARAWQRAAAAPAKEGPIKAAIDARGSKEKAG